MRAGPFARTAQTNILKHALLLGQSGACCVKMCVVCVCERMAVYRSDVSVSNGLLSTCGIYCIYCVTLARTRSCVPNTHFVF